MESLDDVYDHKVISDVARKQAMADAEKTAHEEFFGTSGKWTKQPLIRFPHSVHYETLFWIGYFAWTIYLIVDRFIGNFLPPVHTLNSPMLTNASPLAVRFFDNFNRATGRLFVSTCTALIWTQCKTSENLIQRYAPDWLVLGDMRSTNNRIHYLLAMWGLCVPMYVHLFTIFLPVMVNGASLEITAGAPAGALTPFVKADGFNLFISNPDVVRLVLALIMFFFVLPLSISNFLRRFNFNVAHWLHIFGALLFIEENLRGNHPHAQLFNTPMLVFYGIDRICGLLIWKEEWTFVDRRSFDNNTVHVYYFKTNVPRNKLVERPIGNLHYVKVHGSGEPLLNFSHPYTVFYNRTGEALSQQSRDGVSLVVDATGKLVPTPVQFTAPGSNAGPVDDWDVGLVMRSVHSNRGAHAFSVLAPAHDDLCQTWTSWGPYQSEYSNLKRAYEDGGVLILQATSAGLSFIMDFAFHVRQRARESESGFACHTEVHVLLSTRSFELIQWASEMLSPLIQDHGWHFQARFTQAEGVLDPMKEGPSESEFRARWKVGGESLEELLIRLEKRHLSVTPKVFFCGDPLIQWASEVTAINYDCEFFRGSRFSAVGFPLWTRGPDKILHCFGCPKMRKGKRRVCWTNAFPNCWCY